MFKHAQMGTLNRLECLRAINVPSGNLIWLASQSPYWIEKSRSIIHSWCFFLPLSAYITNGRDQHCSLGDFDPHPGPSYGIMIFRRPIFSMTFMTKKNDEHLFSKSKCHSIWLCTFYHYSHCTMFYISQTSKLFSSLPAKSTRFTSVAPVLGWRSPPVVGTWETHGTQIGDVALWLMTPEGIV